MLGVLLCQRLAFGLVGTSAAQAPEVGAAGCLLGVPGPHYWLSPSCFKATHAGKPSRHSRGLFL